MLDRMEIRRSATGKLHLFRDDRSPQEPVPPATTALRLVAEGTLDVWELPGRAGWWVDPVQLETALAEHGLRVEAEAASRRRLA